MTLFSVRKLIRGLYAIIGAIALLAVNACEKEYSCEGCLGANTQDTVVTDTPDTLVTDSTLYTDFTIDGQRFLNISGKNGFGYSWDGQYCFLTNSTGTNQIVTQRGFFIYDSSISDIKTQKIAFYAPGGYNYVKMLLPNDNGVRVFFSDSNGKQWQTDLGLGNQANSSFIITKETIIRNPINNVITGVFFEAAFNCIVYDGLGNHKILTSGKCRYYIWI